jgi:hypothetical protein
MPSIQVWRQTSGYRIPDWAYRDVLFMLIHYSIASFELLERKLTSAEKEALLQVFYAMGTRMGIPALPTRFETWQLMHQNQLKQDLLKSDYTVDLYKQYRKHLGAFRYAILLKVQSSIVPKIALEYLSLKPSKSLPLIIWAYKISRRLRMDTLLKSLLLPAAYYQQIKQLDSHQP